MPEKRLRTTNGAAAPSRKTGSRVFAPFRTIGHVTDDVPFHVQTRGAQYLVTTSVGSCLNTYDAAKLNLLFASVDIPGRVRAVASVGNAILAATSDGVYGFIRGRPAFHYPVTAAAGGNIVKMVCLGTRITLGTDTGLLVTLDASSGHVVTRIDMQSHGAVTDLLHPATYLNKMVVSFADGLVALVNIHTGRVVYEYANLGAPSIVTSMCNAPALDIIGLGMADGTILVHNIRTDTTLLRFRQKGRCTSLSFRSSDHSSAPHSGPSGILASANTEGDIVLWNLDKQRVHHILRQAHRGSIVRVEFLSGQPVMLTSGSDNRLAEWILDSLDGAPRPFKSRSCHARPPSIVRFYPGDSHYMLSAGQDCTLRCISCYNDSQTCELSQGRLESRVNKTALQLEDLRLTQIVSLAAARVREKDWDNVVTAHADDNAAHTWNWQRRAIGAHALPTSDKLPARTVAISGCGNFALVGSAGGSVDMFNMQSGIHRRHWRAHDRAVTGISSAGLGSQVLTCSLDGSVKFWDYQAAKAMSPLATLQFDCALTQCVAHVDSDLVTVVGDDLGIRVIDVATHKVVRELWGHTNRVTDVAFSNDARWLVSAALDNTIRTWDLPSGVMVDGFKVRNVCTSLAFSPGGDFLATTHVNSIGVVLWTNRAQFRPHEVVAQHMRDDEIEEMAAPGVSGAAGVSVVEAALEVEHTDTSTARQRGDTALERFQQLDKSMLTLSLVPRARWQSLVNLDVIRERNKPTEAPKQPEKAPFFLPSLRDVRKGISDGPAVEKEDTEELEEASLSHVRPMHASLPVTGDATATLLRCHAQASEGGGYDSFIEQLKAMSPAATDLCIGGFSLFPPYTELVAFCRALTERLQLRQDFELVQSWMCVFLRKYSDVILASDTYAAPELMDALHDYQAAQKVESARLADLVGYAMGVIEFVRLR